MYTTMTMDQHHYALQPRLIYDNLLGQRIDDVRLGNIYKDSYCLSYYSRVVEADVEYINDKATSTVKTTRETYCFHTLRSRSISGRLSLR